jgi:hypothetical protein
MEGQFTDCWKCGAARDSTPAEGAAVQDPRLQARCHLWVSDDPTQVAEIRRMLLHSGIQSSVCGRLGNEVWLANASDYARARETIGDASLHTLRCSQCGYDLAGLSDLHCPECGKPFGPAWICPACGGENTEEFVKCRRCLADRPVE